MQRRESAADELEQEHLPEEPPQPAPVLRGDVAEAVLRQRLLDGEVEEHLEEADRRERGREHAELRKAEDARRDDRPERCRTRRRRRSTQPSPTGAGEAGRTSGGQCREAVARTDPAETVPIVARWRPRRSTARASSPGSGASSIARRSARSCSRRRSRSSSSTSAISPTSASVSARRPSTSASRTSRSSSSSLVGGRGRGAHEEVSRARRGTHALDLGARAPRMARVPDVPSSVARRRAVRRPPRELPQARRVRPARGRGSAARATRRDLTIVLGAIVLWAPWQSASALLQFFGVDIFGAWNAGWRQPSFLGHHDLAALAALALGLAAAAIVTRRREIAGARALCGRAGRRCSRPRRRGLGRGRRWPCARQRRALARGTPPIRPGRAPGARARRGRGSRGSGVTAVRGDALADFLRFVGVRGDNPPVGVETYSQRTVLAYIGLRIFADNPVVGVGWQRSSRPEVFEPYVDDARTRFPDVVDLAFPAEGREWGVQNLYIQMLADAGVIGLVLLLARRQRRRSRSPGAPLRGRRPRGRWGPACSSSARSSPSPASGRHSGSSLESRSRRRLSPARARGRRRGDGEGSLLANSSLRIVGSHPVASLSPLGPTPRFILVSSAQLSTGEVDKCARNNLRRASRAATFRIDPRPRPAMVPRTVLDAWGADSAKPLASGQGTTFAADDVVFKPVTDENEPVWLAECCEPAAAGQVPHDPSGQSPYGRWVVDGWSAWQRLDGSAVVGDWRRQRRKSRGHFHERHSRALQRPDPARNSSVGSRRPLCVGRGGPRVRSGCASRERGSEQLTPSRWRINWCRRPTQQHSRQHHLRRGHRHEPFWRPRRLGCDHRRRCVRLEQRRPKRSNLLPDPLGVQPTDWAHWYIGRASEGCCGIVVRAGSARNAMPITSEPWPCCEKHQLTRRSPGATRTRRPHHSSGRSSVEDVDRVVFGRDSTHIPSSRSPTTTPRRPPGFSS